MWGFSCATTRSCLRSFPLAPPFPLDWKKRARGASVSLPQAGQVPGPSSKQESQSRQSARRRNGKWSTGALRAVRIVLTAALRCELDAKPNAHPLALFRGIGRALTVARATPASSAGQTDRQRVAGGSGWRGRPVAESIVESG